VKKTANPSFSDVKNFKSINKLNKKVGTGTIICLYDEIIPIGDNIISMPVWEI
jgi:hypothetical protein